MSNGNHAIARLLGPGEQVMQAMRIAPIGLVKRLPAWRWEIGMLVEQIQIGQDFAHPLAVLREVPGPRVIASN